MMNKPTLPDCGIDYPEATLEWFESWRRSNITDTWTELQWQYLFDTALLHASVWGMGNFQSMGELRRRQETMGLSFTQQAKPQSKTPLQLIRAKQERKAK